HNSKVMRVVGDRVSEEVAEHLGRLIEGRPGLLDLNRIVPEVREAELLQKLAAIRVWICAHPALALGRKSRQLGDESPVGVEQLLGVVAAQPLVKDAQMLWFAHVV